MAIEYAFYKGDTLLAMGTVEEIAEQTGLAVKTIKHYGMPAYKKRVNPNGNVKWLESLDGPLMAEFDSEKVMEDLKKSGIRKTQVGPLLYRDESFMNALIHRKRTKRETLKEVAELLGADADDWIIEEDE